MSKAAAEHKAKVSKCALECEVPIIAHFDGKILEDITDGKKSKRDRFAVLVNIGGEFKLLGIPAMDHGSAEAQYDALVALLEEWLAIPDGRALPPTCFMT